MMQKPKYYYPSRMLVNNLSKYYDGSDSTSASSGGRKQPKKKFDAVEHTFQALVDVVYFLESIETHPELISYFENDLVELFGIQNHNPQSYSPTQECILDRFLSSTLLNRLSKLNATSTHSKESDFRCYLIQSILNNAQLAMEARINNNDENILMSQDLMRAIMWSNLLASRVRQKRYVSTKPRAIGFSRLERAEES